MDFGEKGMGGSVRLRNLPAGSEQLPRAWSICGRIRYATRGGGDVHEAVGRRLPHQPDRNLRADSAQAGSVDDVGALGCGALDMSGRDSGKRLRMGGDSHFCLRSE